MALFKGAAMGSFGLWVLACAVLGALDGEVPLGAAMGVTALAALVANMTVTVLLYRYRHGDSNMRSVWLCTRNDVLVNFAVLLAASGVLAFDSRWPDLLVAAVIAGLALIGAVQVIRHARADRRSCAE